MVTGKSIIERRRSSLMESVVGGHRLNRSGVTWDDKSLTGGGRCWGGGYVLGLVKLLPHAWEYVLNQIVPIKIVRYAVLFLGPFGRPVTFC